MNILKNVKSYFLPKEIDFFAILIQQTQLSHCVSAKLGRHLEDLNPQNLDKILDDIDSFRSKRKASLIELHQSFITPVDKEAINRCYAKVYEIELSFKHLIIELKTYQEIDTSYLKESFAFIAKSLAEIIDVLSKIENKKYDEALEPIEKIFHLNNLFSYQFSKDANRLFKESEVYKLNVNREILSQFKSIMNHCIQYTNDLSDIIFKLT